MLELILSIILSFTITFSTLPVIIFLAHYIHLYDYPDERKVHKVPVPALGGLGIFAGIIITSLILISFSKNSEFQYFMAAILIVFFLGLKDDLVALSPSKKFIGQSLSALLVIIKGNLQIKNMYGFLGVYELPELYSLLISYFTVIVIINSMNLIDGIDGLAGSIGLMAALILGIYFWVIGQIAYSILSFTLSGSLVAFLFFNFSPARIFMGDTGSLVMGLVCAILLLKFILISEHNQVFPVTASPAMAFSVLMVPLLDTLRVFSIRLSKRRSPFSPDNNHIHHILLAKGLSHFHITLLLVGVNALVIFLSFWSRSIGTNWLLLAIGSVFFCGIGLLKFMQRRRHIDHNGVAFSEDIIKRPPDTRVVNINTKVSEPVAEEKKV